MSSQGLTILCEHCGHRTTLRIQDHETPPTHSVETSQAASFGVAPRYGSRQRAILDELIRLGSHGATCDELEVTFDALHQSISSALWTLMHKGLVSRGPDMRTTRTDNEAYVYRAIPTLFVA